MEVSAWEQLHEHGVRMCARHMKHLHRRYLSHSDLHFHYQAISCWGSDILGWGPLPKRKMWSAVTQKLSKDLANQPRIHRRSETAHRWFWNAIEWLLLLQPFLPSPWHICLQRHDRGRSFTWLRTKWTGSCFCQGSKYKQVPLPAASCILLFPFAYSYMSTFSCALPNPPNWTQLHQCITWGKLLLSKSKSSNVLSFAFKTPKYLRMLTEPTWEWN